MKLRLIVYMSLNLTWMYCSLPIISLVFAKEEIMLPEEQEKKFQGAIPIKTVIIN